MSQFLGGEGGHHSIVIEGELLLAAATSIACWLLVKFEENIVGI